MSYLISEMWACLLIAAVIGAVLGWMLRSISCNTKLEEQDAQWRQKVKQLESEADKTQTSATTAKSIVQDEASSPIPSSSKGTQTSYDVEELDGIGNTFGSKLRDKGISTTQQLLGACESLDGRIEIANHIGIEDFVVQKWASMADLVRVSGIEGTLSELMVYARIDSVEILGEQEASTFLNKLTKINNEQQRVESLPNLTTLEIMIAEAKSLPKKLADI